MAAEDEMVALWVRVDANLIRHPKLRRAARTAGVSPGRMVGVVVTLWGWAQQFAPDGDISRFSPDEIAEAVEWEGDAAVLWRALTLNGDGFIDVREQHGAGRASGTRGESCTDGKWDSHATVHIAPEDASRAHARHETGASPLLALHDWEEYGGRLHRQREATAERVRRHRAKNGEADGPAAPIPEAAEPSGALRNAHVTVTSALRNALEKRREEESSTEENNARARAPEGADGEPPTGAERKPERIAADWWPDEAKLCDLAKTRYAGEGGEPWVREQTERMRDWFLASGSKKLDWNLTWQTWLRGAAERRQAGRGKQRREGSGSSRPAAPRSIGSPDEFDRTAEDYAARWGRRRDPGPA